MMKVHSKEALEFSSFRGWVLCIEGLIGIGKSTLIKSLYEFFQMHGFEVIYFPENITEEFLKLYLSDMKRYAFSFQICALQDRFEIHRQAFEFAKRGGIALIDRGIYGDMAFAHMQHDKGFFTEEEWNVYNVQIRSKQLCNPSFILHLVCDSQTSIERVKRRNHSEESVYTPEYMDDLHAAHDKALKNYPGPLLRRKWHNLAVSNGMIESEVCKDVLREIMVTFQKWNEEN